jgi:DNA-directed RNA polymerase subunit K/omega
MPRGQNNNTRSAARPKSKAKPGSKSKAKKVATKTKTVPRRVLKREETKSEVAPSATDKIEPDVENQADVEDINDLINPDIETDEEWESEGDEEAGADADEGYDNQFVDSDAEDADDCAYDVTRRKKPGLNLDDIDEDDDLDDDEDEFEDPSAATHKVVVPESQRICRSMITKYERVRLLSDRTTQLALGAKPMIRGVEKIQHLDREKMIAQLEFEARVIPIIIERERPDGNFEHWKISELRYKDDMIVYGKEAFADPTNLTVDPEYLKKRTKEIQSGGNITGFSKVSQSETFTLPKTSFSDSARSWKNPDISALEALLGIDQSGQSGGAKKSGSKTKPKAKAKPKPKAKAKPKPKAKAKPKPKAKAKPKPKAKARVTRRK